MNNWKRWLKPFSSCNFWRLPTCLSTCLHPFEIDRIVGYHMNFVRLVNGVMPSSWNSIIRMKFIRTKIKPNSWTSTKRESSKQIHLDASSFVSSSWPWSGFITPNTVHSRWFSRISAKNFSERFAYFDLLRSLCIRISNSFDPFSIFFDPFSILLQSAPIGSARCYQQTALNAEERKSSVSLSLIWGRHTPNTPDLSRQSAFCCLRKEECKWIWQAVERRVTSSLNMHTDELHRWTAWTCTEGTCTRCTYTNEHAEQAHEHTHKCTFTWTCTYTHRCTF